MGDVRTGKALSIRRIARGAVALAGVWLPFFAAWLLLAVLIESRQAAAPAGSPNPAKALVPTLGPGELLVYVEPYFTDVVHFWYCLIIATSAGWLIWSVALTPQCRPAGKAAWRCRWLRLTAVSIAIGFVLAAPWYYVLLLVISA